jgi:hypothetical protein
VHSSVFVGVAPRVVVVGLLDVVCAIVVLGLLVVDSELVD